MTSEKSARPWLIAQKPMRMIIRRPDSSTQVSTTLALTLSPTAKDPYGNPLAHLHFSYAEEDLALLDRTREKILQIFAKVGATEIEEAEVTWSRHHIGTCRMGASPTTSVCDPNLLVHGCDNLYLSGCETFVTGAAVPPVATISALAHRLSDHLAERLVR